MILNYKKLKKIKTENLSVYFFLSLSLLKYFRNKIITSENIFSYLLLI